MITGMLSPVLNERMVYPNTLLSQLDSNWIIDGNTIPKILKAFEIKKQLFLSKLNNDFNLLSFVIRVPDCITHHPYLSTIKTKKEIYKSYAVIDDFIGILLERSDIDNIFIISDHGLKLYHKEFNIRRFLESKGRNVNTNDFISKLLSIMIKFFGYLNPKYFDTVFFHNKVKEIFKRMFGRELTKSKSAKGSKDLKFVHFYSNYGGVFLDKDQSDKRELIKQELFHSKYIDQIFEYRADTMPDLIIKLKEKYLLSVKSSYFRTNRSNSYNHSDKGIFMAYGKNIQKKFLGQISYYDFAPTLLMLYGINIPPYMEGKPLDILK